MPSPSEPNNLALVRPDLAKEWHPTRNGALSPRNVSPESHQEAWWLCEKGHWWSASVAARVAGMTCTYCQEIQKQGGQHAIDVMPELLREWHPSRNYGLQPREVLCQQSGEVWWLCERGHEWQASVGSRLEGEPCPECARLFPAVSTRRQSKPGPSAEPPTAPPLLSARPPLSSFHELPASYSSGRELRGRKRYQLLETVLLESPQTGMFGYAQMVNFSAGGMLIRSEFPIKPGTQVRIQLEKPLYATRSNLVVSRVVWCQRLGDGSERDFEFDIGLNQL